MSLDHTSPGRLPLPWFAQVLAQQAMTKAGNSPAGPCSGWSDDGDAVNWTKCDPNQEAVSVSEDRGVHVGRG